jgi:hypothetical protein
LVVNGAQEMKNGPGPSTTFVVQHQICRSSISEKKYEVHIFLDELYLWHMHIMVSEHLEISQNIEDYNRFIMQFGSSLAKGARERTPMQWLPLQHYRTWGRHQPISGSMKNRRPDQSCRPCPQLFHHLASPDLTRLLFPLPKMPLISLMIMTP